MVIIHGANSAAVEMGPFIEAVRPYAQAVAPSLPGHGGRALPERMTVADFAADVIAYMDREGIARDVITGYSFGGLVALYIARHYPQRVTAVVALATKHVFDDATIAHWTHLVQPERLARPGNPRTAELERIHAPNDWRDVARENAKMFASLRQDPPLTESDLRSITVPVMVVSSNLDQIVPWSETLALGKRIPGSHVAMFYGPAHPLRAAPLLAIARAIGGWMKANNLS
jgi:pimeloyl-ACP methyl ester carboxylesterase